MSRWSAERWAASSGIAFAIILVVANLATASPPKYYASPEKIGNYLQDHHRALTISSLLGGLLIILFVWFLSSFVGYLHDAGQDRLSRIVYGGGLLTAGVALIADAISVAAVRLNVFDGADTAAVLYAITWFLYLRLFWPAAAMAFATALAVRRSGAFAGWYAAFSLVVGIVFVLGGVALRQKGFFSPAGAMGFVSFIALPLWVLVSSVLLVQKVGATEASAPGGAPAPA